MRPIRARWLIADGVAIEETPLSSGLIEVHRGALVRRGSPGAVGYRDAAPAEPAPVVVRLLQPHQDDRDEVVATFTRVTAARASLGPPAPRLLEVLGRGGAVLGSVEELVTGARLCDLLAALEARRELLPTAMALSIARAAMTPRLRGHRPPRPSRLSINPRRVRIDEQGAVRVLPLYEEERARQAVGAALLHFDDVIAYSAPEVVAGLRADERATMFVVGEMLFEMLTGQHPLGRGRVNAFDVMSSLTAGQWPRLRDARPGLHPALNALVDRCLAADPQARFASLDDLAHALAGLEALFARDPAAERSLLSSLSAIERRALPEVEARSLENAEAPRLERVAWPSLDEPGAAPSRPRKVLDREAVYEGRDARPMLAASPSLLIDARPVTLSEYERYLLTTRSIAPSALSSAGAGDDEAPAVGLTHDEAAAYARWAGKRLPTEAEWQQAVEALGAVRLATGLVWELTSTPWPSGGHVVRGGRWRDQPGQPPDPGHRSFEDKAAPDVGFRCVRERS